MKVYFGFSSGDAPPELLEHRVSRIVTTPVLDPKMRFPVSFPYPLDVLIDSGAFSVWNSGRTIDIDEYIEWALAYRQLVHEAMIVNLDVIPGERGRRPTPPEQRRAIKQSMKNADYMRSAGIPVMEVYHRHDPHDFLDTVLERRRPGEIVGLGVQGGKASGMVPSTFRAFGNFVFSRVMHHSGQDVSRLIPVHGLGVAPDAPLAAFPFYSIDSTSWLASGTFGRPVGPDGRWIGAGGSDRRVENMDVRHIYHLRKIDGYLRLEKQLTRLWDDRGVRYDLPGGEEANNSGSSTGSADTGSGRPARHPAVAGRRPPPEPVEPEPAA